MALEAQGRAGLFVHCARLYALKLGTSCDTSLHCPARVGTASTWLNGMPSDDPRRTCNWQRVVNAFAVVTHDSTDPIPPGLALIPPTPCR